jgi:hypothetical protein
MIKLRNRLLITLVLAAVAFSAFGVGPALAARHGSSSRAVSVPKPRPRVGPCAGDPDVGSTGAPRAKPTSVVPVVTPGGAPLVVDDTLLLHLWALWMGRRP